MQGPTNIKCRNVCIASSDFCLFLSGTIRHCTLDTCLVFLYNNFHLKQFPLRWKIVVHVCVHEKYPWFLSDFTQSWDESNKFLYSSSVSWHKNPFSTLSLSKVGQTCQANKCIFVVFGCKRTKNQTSEWKVVLQYRKSGEQIGISQALLWNMHASFYESTKLLLPWCNTKLETRKCVLHLLSPYSFSQYSPFMKRLITEHVLVSCTAYIYLSLLKQTNCVH